MTTDVCLPDPHSGPSYCCFLSQLLPWSDHVLPPISLGVSPWLLLPVSGLPCHHPVLTVLRASVLLFCEHLGHVSPHGFCTCLFLYVEQSSCTLCQPVHPLAGPCSDPLDQSPCWPPYMKWTFPLSLSCLPKPASFSFLALITSCICVSLLLSGHSLWKLSLLNSQGVGTQNIPVKMTQCINAMKSYSIKTDNVPWWCIW